MHYVYVEEVGLSLPLTAEVQFVDCVISALFSVGRKIESRRNKLQLHQSPFALPPVNLAHANCTPFWKRRTQNNDSPKNYSFLTFAAHMTQIPPKEYNFTEFAAIFQFL